MKSPEEQAEEYAEALNDIADILELPTGATSKDMIAKVWEYANALLQIKEIYEEVRDIYHDHEEMGEIATKALKRPWKKNESKKQKNTQNAVGWGV